MFMGPVWFGKRLIPIGVSRSGASARPGPCLSSNSLRTENGVYVFKRSEKFFYVSENYVNYIKFVNICYNSSLSVHKLKNMEPSHTFIDTLFVAAFALRGTELSC